MALKLIKCDSCKTEFYKPEKRIGMCKHHFCSRGCLFDYKRKYPKLFSEKEYARTIGKLLMYKKQKEEILKKPKDI